jgi:hypothetical protein
MINEKLSRRCKFKIWLLQAWEWSADNHKSNTSADIAELLCHIDEEDYPAWEKARQCGVIGDTALADRLRNILGLPLQTPQPTNWEREINFCPVIALEPEVFQRIYNSLGWSNRFVDLKYPRTNFWLWSDSGNLVRFVRREPVKEVESE